MQISEIGISAVVCNQEFCSEVDKKYGYPKFLVGFFSVAYYHIHQLNSVVSTDR